VEVLLTRGQNVCDVILLFANGGSWQNLATTHYQNTQELAEIDLNFWIV
jgi:hypothetical protein